MPKTAPDGSVQLAGRIVGQDARKGIFLYRLSGPMRQTSQVTGLYPNDTWSGPTVRYRRLDCAGGSLTVRLESDPSLFTRPQSVVATVAGRRVGSVTVPSGQTRLIHVPLEREGRVCTVTFTVTPTAVPVVVTKGENTDNRELGIHFTGFDYSS